MHNPVSGFSGKGGCADHNPPQPSMTRAKSKSSRDRRSRRPSTPELAAGRLKALLGQLGDHGLEVKYEAVKSLHTLVANEGEKVCIMLSKKRILKRLEKALTEVISLKISLINIKGLYGVPDRRIGGRQVCPGIRVAILDSLIRFHNSDMVPVPPRKF